ncbi:hypothetical protein [Caballeronia terrestris]|jgi:hypothetical protein|uniref:hypothetical protein n=1 Tax=Caballeronia terrestris TaxID=1226301 RepID=UPI00190EEBD5|nr:hypothetical protein [Caballeronia terrestris]
MKAPELSRLPRAATAYNNELETGLAERDAETHKLYKPEGDARFYLLELNRCGDDSASLARGNSSARPSGPFSS